MNTEPLGYGATPWHRWSVGGVALSKHRPLFTQTRQGLEKKMTSEEYDYLLLWRLETANLGLKGQQLLAGQGIYKHCNDPRSRGKPNRQVRLSHTSSHLSPDLLDHGCLRGRTLLTLQ
jgi:hypothetical protein